jgi:hypothetical protein
MFCAMICFRCARKSARSISMSLSEMLFDAAPAAGTLCDAGVWEKARIDRLGTNSTQAITRTGLKLFFRIIVSSEIFKGQSLLAPFRAREQARDIHLPYQLAKVTAQ